MASEMRDCDWPVLSHMPFSMDHRMGSGRRVSRKGVAGAHAGHVIPEMSESCFRSRHSFFLRSTHHKKRKQIKRQLYYY